MTEEKDPRIEEAFRYMVEEAYESHHFIYLNTADKDPEVPHFEGVDDFTVGNITFYFPATAQLGTLHHGTFRPYMQHRWKRLGDLRERATQQIQTKDAEAEEQRQLKAVSDRHQQQARQERDVIRAKKEAPKTEVKGASEKTEG